MPPFTGSNLTFATGVNGVFFGNFATLYEKPARLLLAVWAFFLTFIDLFAPGVKK
jgi:hypothetical protein